MGQQSDRLQSAVRPGKRERARRKRLTKPSVWSSVLGADTTFIRYGPHKSKRVWAFLVQGVGTVAGPSSGEPDNGESGQKCQTAKL